MDISKFYHAMTVDQKRQYAADVGTTVEYCRVHLFPKSGRPDRKPGMDKLVRLAEHSGGMVTVTEVIDYFSDRKDAAA